MRIQVLLEQIQSHTPSTIVLTSDEYASLRSEVHASAAYTGDVRLINGALWYRSAPIVPAPYSRYSYMVEDCPDGPVIYMLR